MVELSDSVYEGLLWDRIREFEPARGYENSFWEEAIQFWEDCGFTGDPDNNDPMYFIDNIAVNGEILDEDELKEYDYIKKDQTIDDYIGDGIRVGNYIVFNWGL